MSIRTDRQLMDGMCLRDALLRARDLVQAHVEEINRLNVFPVPDGDTGTNMYLTLNAIAEGLEEVGTELTTMLEVISHSALLGARGNSGVILSQFLAGFAAALKGRNQLGPADLAAGFAAGTQEAYRIVSHPKEGTILTIMRAAAEELLQNADRGLDEMFTRVVSRAQETLARTPEMLPILKRAGVIDAGGLGFVYLLEAFREVVTGEEEREIVADLDRPDPEALVAEGPLTHRYCTEFTVHSPGTTARQLRAHLGGQGDSLLVLGEGDLFHVHLHTDDPGAALRTAAEYGRVSQVKIDDMYRQVRAFVDASEPRTDAQTGVVTISPGDGFAEIMRSLGANEVLVGRPSVGELLTALARVTASEVVILPNAADMILTAHQAAKLGTKRVVVVETASAPQGLAALLAFDPTTEARDLAPRMERLAAQVRTGTIGRAVRKTAIDGISVREGDLVGITDGRIVAAGRELKPVVLKLVGELIAAGGEVVTLFYRTGARAAAELREAVAAAHPGIDVQVYYGGQPDHEYIVAVE